MVVPSQFESFNNKPSNQADNPLRTQFVAEMMDSRTKQDQTLQAITGFSKFLDSRPSAAVSGPRDSQPSAPTSFDARPSVPQPTITDRTQNAFANSAALAYARTEQQPPSYEQEVRARLAAANKNFITQNPSEWNTSAPGLNTDCGPAVLAMAMKSLHVAPEGVDPAHAEELVSQMRQAMTGRVNHMEDTSPLEMKAAAEKYGVRTAWLQGLKNIDDAVTRGMVVAAVGIPDQRMANGQLRPTWASRLSEIEYSHNDKLHFVLISGKDSHGNYVINDPLSKVGSLSVTPAEMQTFITARGAPNAGLAMSRNA